MTTPHEDELSPEARAFLAHHADTGEPDDAQLARGAARVEVLAPPPRGVPRWLAPLAAAVVLSVGLGFVALDVPLADDTLARPDEWRRRPFVKPPPPAAADVQDLAVLLARAEVARVERRFDDALAALDQCLATDAGAADCHRLLGAVQADLAVREQSSSAREEARQAWVRYLALASPDDPEVPKIKARLAELPSPGDKEKMVVLEPGYQKVVSFSATVERVAVGNASLIDVRPTGGATVVVTGIARGKTTVTVVLEGGTRETRLVEVR